jgi:pimeloyl-ACP methyl ester carboxylesterase
MFDDLRNAQGRRLDCAFVPGASGARELVIVGHGVTSSHDRPWLVELSQALAREGLASLRVSFAGNGDSEGRFEDATPQQEAEDLGAVLDAAAGWRTAYVGHSMGAAVGVLRAARDERIAALASLAGMLDVARFFERHFAALPYGAPMLGKARCPWSRELDLAARALGSLEASAHAVRVPWLLVHGTADELVPHQDSLDAARAAGPLARVELLEGVDHRFTGAIEPMTRRVAPWLRRTFDERIAP